MSDFVLNVLYFQCVVRVAPSRMDLYAQFVLLESISMVRDALHVLVPPQPTTLDRHPSTAVSVSDLTNYMFCIHVKPFLQCINRGCSKSIWKRIFISLSKVVYMNFFTEVPLNHSGYDCLPQYISEIQTLKIILKT